DPATGRVRHLYVLAAHRRRGLGERLVTEIIAAARGHFHTLRLSTSNPDAARLYERLGFCPPARLAKCTHVIERASPLVCGRSHRSSWWTISRPRWPTTAPGSASPWTSRTSRSTRPSAATARRCT